MHRVLLGCAGSADMAPIIQDFDARADIDLFPVDAAPEKRLSAVTNRYAKVPSGDAPGYIDSVLAIAQKEHINFIIPKSDEEAYALMHARERFAAANIKIAVQKDSLGPILKSKSACYAYLAKKHFPVPQHKIVTQKGELTEALTALNYPHSPVIMKPDTARGGRGVCVIATTPHACDEAIPVYSPEYAAMLLNGTTPYICMQYKKGIIYDIDVLQYANGDMFFGARGRFQNVTKHFSGNVFTTNEAILNLARRCYEALPTTFLIDYDIIVTEEGECILLEVNPRPSGSTVSYIPFGTNLFYVLAKSHMDNIHLPIETPPEGAAAIVTHAMVKRQS
jgi:biotin carboxylase